MVNAENTCFLNVDLDIYSRSNLQPLVTALGTSVMVHYAGREKLCYSTHLGLAGKQSKNADEAIRRFCALIQALPADVRQLWNGAKIRELNIGVQAAASPIATVFTITAKTVRATAEVDVQIGFTVCAPAKRKHKPRSTLDKPT